MDKLHIPLVIFLISLCVFSTLSPLRINIATAMDQLAEDAVFPINGTYFADTEDHAGECYYGSFKIEDRIRSLASFSRHVMCKGHDGNYDPVNPTTVFAPSDSIAECLTTVSMQNKIQFMWYYRSDSSKTWDYYWDWSESPGPGSYYYWSYIFVSGYWPGSNYPRGWKVDIYLDDSFYFSEYFEITDGGLTSHVTCGDVADGNPVNTKSIFYKDTDTKVHHYVRIDNVAYFNDDNDHCHDGQTVWYSPAGIVYRTYLFYWPDYKDQNPVYDYWSWAYVGNDFISIDPSTTTGTWKVEFYLDGYYNEESKWYGPIAVTQFEIKQTAPQNHAPILSDGYIDGESPWWGYTDTTFQFLVKYTDQDGDPPATKRFYVYDAGWQFFDMDHLAGNPMDGEWFTVFLKDFTPGTHNCFYHFTDQYGADPYYPNNGYLTFTVLARGADLYALPAGSKRTDPSDPSTDGTKLLVGIDLNGGGETISVQPGETVSVNCNYQLWSFGNPTELDQLFFIYSWTPSWPPSSDYYHGVYDGMPGPYPGVSGSDSFTLTAPLSDGIYYLYWCSGAHYSIPQAVNEYNQELTTPAHAKIIVGGKPEIRVEPTSLSFDWYMTGSSMTASRLSENNTSWWEDWIKDSNKNKIDDSIERLSATFENFDIFVDFDVHPAGNVLESLEQWLDITDVYENFDMIAATNVPLSIIMEHIVKLPHVVMIELQGSPLKGTLDVSTKAIKARPSSYSPNTAWEKGYTGKGINIAILDSGVDDEHESLDGKFIAGFNAVTDVEENPDDITGHGTHVAGIALGTGGSSQIYRGVAPDAKLIDVKVLTGPMPGSGTPSDLIQGIDWCISKKDVYDIRVMSISIGVAKQNSDGTDAMSRAVNRAVDEGIAVVVSAGNDGPARYIGPIAAADEAITVAAIDDHNTVDRSDDDIASFSSRGPRDDDGDSDSYDELKPDISAPGFGIISAKFNTVSEYWSMSGTSMAAPHVSGVVALMLERDLSLTPFQIKNTLHNTAEDKDGTYNPDLDTKYDVAYGWGEVDAFSAVLSILYRTLKVYNDGDADLAISAISSNRDWLSASPSSFTVMPKASQDVTATVDPSDLSIGAHSGILEINSNDAHGNDHVEVYVTLNVIDKASPPSPAISSLTHPDEQRWYSNNDPELQWTTPEDPSGIQGYSYEFDRFSYTTPDTTVDTILNSMSLTDVADGEWWFHIQAVDNVDNWGEPDHYRIKVDTTPPSCSITHTSGSASAYVEATDAMPGSGVYAIYVRIDAGSWTEHLGNGPVEIFLDGTGSHVIDAYSVDAADPHNTESPQKSLSFHYLTVNTNPPSLDDPFGEGWYDEGTEANINVDNVPRYEFKYWYLDGQADNPYSTSMSTTVAMEEPHTATAKFAVGKTTLEKNAAWYKIDDTHTFSTFTFDVDADGQTEILTCGQWKDAEARLHGELIIWRWDGSALFLEKCSRWLTMDNTCALSVFAADVDNDGQTEIITGGAYFDGVQWRAQLIVWQWDGSTLTIEKVSKWYRIGNTRINAVFASDVDKDGKIEIITACTFNDGEDNAQLLIWNWNGVTMNIEKNVVWQTEKSTTLSSVFAFDVNVDGYVEIFTAGWYELLLPPYTYRAQLRMWRWDGSTMNLISDRKWSDGDTYINCIFASDVDGDGQAEILTGGDFFDGTRHQAQLIIWDGNSMTIEKKQNWYYKGDTYLSSISASDIDGDYECEIVTGGTFNDGAVQIAQLVVWRWDGITLTLKETVKWLYSTFGDTYIASIATANVDGDMETEIVTVGFLWDGLRWRAQLRIWSRQ